MKIFIDTADLDEIKKAYGWGVADGVTTNPSLLKKAVGKREGVDLKQYIKEVLSVAGNTPVSLEVTETNSEGMVREGLKLHQLFSEDGNVNIKVPVNPSFEMESESDFEGLKTIKALADEGVPVNCTLVFTPEQALLAAKSGATYVSPFAGRIDDLLRCNAKLKYGKTDYYPAEGLVEDHVLLEDNGILSGIDLVQQCVELLTYYDLNTQVIAASLRNTRQVREAALVGAHIATVPPKVISAMLRHVKTCEGMQKFTEDVVEEYANLK
ncbi:MAG: transaldolase [Candidatus Altiarchaeales archaeon]|nr:transaldolase [Candidatus Altiarchaeales archaeon]